MADDKRYMGFWIGHLHVGERNRIHSGGLNPQEREMLAKGEDPWAKFRGPLPPNIPAYVPPKDNPATPKAPPPARKPAPDVGKDREPTEAEVLAIMHDDDLLEYNSSSRSDLRRNSMFEHYRRQWKAARAVEERSKKVEALRRAFSPALDEAPTPNASLPSRRDEPTTEQPGFGSADAASENKPEQTLPRSHRISRVFAGGLFALFFGALIQALTLFGVITLNSGHIFMAIAFVAGVLMITTEILPLKPTRHKVGAIVILGVVLGLIDLAAALYAHKRDASPESLPQSKMAVTQSQDDLRSELRADGNRAIRTLSMRIGLKRKYSIEEIGHFRIMYEVARITNRITPDFYLAYRDYYAKNELNASVDPNVKQFGYRTTVFYRGQNNTYRAIPSYNISPRKYGGAVEASTEVDHFEATWDLYNQISSYKVLDDLNGKSLYIFVTESLVDKISSVSFRVNNWELFSVTGDRLIFPDDQPIAPWFAALSKEEKAVLWKGVYLRNDEPLPPQVIQRFRGQNPGWVWSLDFGVLHPKKIPEPELKVDPFKPS